MTTINPSYLPSYLGITSSPYSNTATSTTQSAVQALTNDTNSASSDAATNVLLSDAAKAYLAAANTTDTTATPAVPQATLAANARTWFDEQYKTKNITSPMKDGEPAVDMSGQSRETLVAITTNAQKLFSTDEQAAATNEMQSRFKDAVAPYIAIARKTGNYTALYQAASDYLDKAGPDERATKSWQDTKKAVVDGLAAAKNRPGQAPDTGNANDPIRALLDQREADGSASAGATPEKVTANARAMLDDQANAASDEGKMLVFDQSSKTGQPVDFSDFDNRTLATMALNKDEAFSGEESFAAKNELNLRTRTAMMGVLNPSSGSASGIDVNLGLIGTYEKMSDEEREALGVTDAVTDRLITNFQTMQSLQSAFAGGGSMTNPALMGLSALLANPDDDGSNGTDISMGLAGLM